MGKRLKHLIFPGNKMVVVKKKRMFLPRARPEWNAAGAECSSPAGVFGGLTQQEMLCKQRLEGFGFMVQRSLHVD